MAPRKDVREDGSKTAAEVHADSDFPAEKELERHHDPQVVKRIVRKLDICIMPCLMFMYLANYVDRSNLASARLKGLEKDLNLTSLQYSNAISLFFLPYCLFQPFTTSLLAHVKKPTYLICGCMLFWGIVSLATGFVHNYAQLMVVRILLGVAESLFYPGCLFLISRFYTRQESAKRVGGFYSAALVSSGFGSLFAAGVIDGTDGLNGVRGWRYLFYVEGAITVGMAFVIAFILPNFPGTAPILTPEERIIAVQRLTEDIGQADEDEDEPWIKSFLHSLKNPLTYILAITWWCLVAALSFNSYSPTLVQSLGFSGTNALLLNAPTYVLALILTNINSWHSDRTRERSLHVMAGIFIGIVGCIILLATTQKAARFVGLFLMTGGYASYSVFLAFASNCFPGRPKRRAAAIGWLVAFANTASIAGGYFFVGSMFGPTYRGSFAIVLAMFIAAFIGVLMARLWLMRVNAKLAKKEEELLAQGADAYNDSLTRRTAEIEGVDTHEAALMKASFRYYL